MMRERPNAQRGAAVTTRRDRAITDCAAELWRKADTLRGSMAAAEYLPVVLGLIFLKYISDAFEECRVDLLPKSDEDSLKDRNACAAENVFWVPPEARWTRLRVQARESAIGSTVDQAMTALECDNPALADVLPKDYTRLALGDRRLGQLIDLISSCPTGDEDSRTQDVAGCVFDYFLSQFAKAEGRTGDGFHTPRCVANVLVEMLEPFRGKVHDPCCGTAAMLVQSAAFHRNYFDGNGKGGKSKTDISIHGQELNHWAWRIGKMNLVIRGIEGQIALGDSFHNDRHTGLKADFILAHPPFGNVHWSGEPLAQDKRWHYGIPPQRNANFAWIQHMVHHLTPGGIGGCVLPNGSMSSNQREEKEIRKNLIEANLVDCMVALPGQLFHFTQMPVCLWLLARRRHRGEILFIDARRLGRMVERTHRELTEDDIARIAGTYHAWRDGSHAFGNVAGFCRSVPLNEVRRHSHSLTPWRYVGAEPQSSDCEPFETKMHRLIAELQAQQAEGAQLDTAIVENLQSLGFKTEATAGTAQNGSLRAGFVSPTGPSNS